MAWVTGKRGAFRAQWREGGKVISGEMRADRGEAEADKRAKEAELAEVKHRKRPGPSMPVSTLLALWKESRTAEKRVRGPYAKEVEDTLTDIAEELGWVKVSDVTRGSWDAYKVKRGGVGINRPLAMLKSVLRFGRRVHGLPVPEALLDAEPVRRPKKAQPPLLTDMQVAAILGRASEFGPHVAALMEHLALYGCRPIDLCKIVIGDWKSADRKMQYRDTKNGETQYRRVHESHAKKLDALCLDDEGKRRPDTAALFLAPNNLPWRINEKGSAEQLSSFYKTNIGEPLLIQTIDGVTQGWLEPSQRGIYTLKDYGITKIDRLTGGNTKLVMAMSQHKTESAMKRYKGTNDQDQLAVLALIPEPAAPLKADH